MAREGKWPELALRIELGTEDLVFPDEEP